MRMDERSKCPGWAGPAVPEGRPEQPVLTPARARPRSAPAEPRRAPELRAGGVGLLRARAGNQRRASCASAGCSG